VEDGKYDFVEGKKRFQLVFRAELTRRKSPDKAVGGNDLLKNQKDAGRSLLAPLLSLLREKNSHSPEQIHLCRIIDIGREAARGRFPSEEPVVMRRPTVLVPLDRTMQLPLTLAGRLRTTFADVVSSRLQADRNERSGEERKWGMQ
jgi:hypothetical protein